MKKYAFLTMFFALVSASGNAVACYQKTSSSANKGDSQREQFGASDLPDGDPLGGGDGYRRAVTEADFRVGTADELATALKKAKAGDVVFVNMDAEIDLTGMRSIQIPAGVTLASGRGTKGAAGGLIFTKEDKPTPPGHPERFALFEAGGDDVRVTGLRLRGPDDQRRGRYEFLNSDGILCQKKRLEVDNCELSGWSHGGVFLQRCTGADIHHNNIHHCQRSGLGYGVVLDAAEAKIRANKFDYCRHCIASTGRVGSGYEACHNLILEHANGHSFDMHGGKDRRDGTHIAGDWMNIHHNTFRVKGQYAVVVRGRPQKAIKIHHNWFPASTTIRAVSQKNAQGNMHVYRNLFGDKN